MQNTSLVTRTQDVLAAIRALAILAKSNVSGVTLDLARNQAEEAIRALHLAKETLLLAPLRDSDDGVHHALARRTVQQDLEWREHMVAHRAAWPAAAVRVDPQGYRTAAQQLLRMAERRIAYQDQVLEPIAREALAASRRAA